MKNRQDDEYLRLLSIFHYVVAGIVGFLSLFPLIHVAIGVAMLNGKFDNADGGQPPPEIVGWLFILFPLVVIFIGLSLAICIMLVGRKLSRRTSYLFCLVVAGLECVFMPFGTVLGVFTILVLLRPSVKLAFGVDDSTETEDHG